MSRVTLMSIMCTWPRPVFVVLPTTADRAWRHVPCALPNLDNACQTANAMVVQPMCTVNSIKSTCQPVNTISCCLQARPRTVRLRPGYWSVVVPRLGSIIIMVSLSLGRRRALFSGEKPPGHFLLPPRVVRLFDSIGWPLYLT